MQRNELWENGPGVNTDYHVKTNIEMEGQFLPKLQNETALKPKTLNEEIFLHTMREQELKKEETILEELRKALGQEKCERMRLEEESVVVKNACRELEERLNKLLTQMRQVLDNKMLLSVANKGNRLREKELVLNKLKKKIEEEKQARSRVEEELNQTKITCKELEQRLGTELKRMQRNLENEIGLRRAREQEKETLSDELRKELSEGKLTLSRVQEETRQARNDCIKLETRLENEREEMQRTLEKEICLRRKTEEHLLEMETNAVMLKKMLSDEQLRRNKLEEELIQATNDHVQEKERLENEREQVQRTVRIERCMRTNTEQLLQEKATNVVALEKMLGDEQVTRTTLEKELIQERTDRIEERERLEKELAETKRTLDIEKRLHDTQKRRLREKEMIIGQIQERLSEAERTRMRMEEKLSQVGSSRNLLAERMENNLQRLLEEERQEKRDLEERLRNLQLEMEQERERHASTGRDWIIQREEVVLSRDVLGRGGWSEVRKGTFRSCQVAVKTMHNLILSDHNRSLFEREMTIVSCCRHPNLLQFIGATNDNGNPLFVTELLDTNLGDVLSQRALNHKEIISLALDAAKGLNYLHLNRPLPVIHQNISSANVLLWRRDECWRAKLSDYGSANFMRQCMTENREARIYSAPEAHTSQQSPKVDVYSFGVLLCEMCIRELPHPHEIHNKIRKVSDRTLRRLIRRCVKTNPEERPATSEVISQLEGRRTVFA